MTTTLTRDSTWLSDEETKRFHIRWEEAQSNFVNDPRESLARADALVADVVERIATRFTEERNGLRGRWNPTDTSTESLRVSFQSYRDLFEALLA
jgi:hypothetical protein